MAMNSPDAKVAAAVLAPKVPDKVGVESLE
jgi:hypothetical protein